MKLFLLDFLNRMSCKNRNGVMLVNKFFKIVSQFFKIRVECPFKLRFDASLTLLYKGYLTDSFYTGEEGKNAPLIQLLH